MYVFPIDKNDFPLQLVPFVLIFFLLAVSAMASEGLNLWYNTPAPSWNVALPLGNGRIAAMVYGNPIHEEFQLNEETISKGSPYTNYNKEALKYNENDPENRYRFGTYGDAMLILQD